MDVSFSLQLLTIAVSIGVGFILGIFRMLLGIITAIFGRNTLVTAICDVIAFTVASFATYCLFIVMTCGNIRGYVLFFEFIGVIIYCLTFGKINVKIEKTVHLKAKAFYYLVKEKVKRKDLLRGNSKSEIKKEEKLLKKVKKCKKRLAKNKL